MFGPRTFKRVPALDFFAPGDLITHTAGSCEALPPLEMQFKAVCQEGPWSIQVKPSFGTQYACRDGCYHWAEIEPMPWAQTQPRQVLVLTYVSPACDFLGTWLIPTIWGLDSSWCLCNAEGRWVAASCRAFDVENPELALTFVSAGGGSPWVRHLFRALESGEATRGPHLWARHLLHRMRSR
jgi:hypothetical protein